MLPRAARACVRLGPLLALALLVAVALTAEPFDPVGLGPGQDARAYWEAARAVLEGRDPYGFGTVGQETAYLYAPAFAQLTAPLGLLPWTAYLVVWTGLLLVALRILAGPLLLAPLLVCTFPELWGGNITLLYALAVVAGLRFTGTWALLILTKVTPGLGLLWFLVRREWRPLAVALAVTGAVAGLSALLAPEAWAAWIGLLRESAGGSTVSGSIPVPLVVRLPLAALVIAWAARRDAAWLLPAGVVLALPVLWPGSLALLVGCVALRRADVEAWLLGLLARPATEGEPAGSL